MKSFLVFMIAAMSTVGFAQNPEPPGTISGTVVDSGRAPVAGATVSAMGSGGMTTVRTDEKGVYTLSVPPGTYSVTATQSKFKPTTQSRIDIASAAAVRVNLTIEGLSASPAAPIRPAQDVMISAESQTVQGDLILYRGSVRMTTSSMMLYADELDFNTVTRGANARGGVTVRVIPPASR